MMLGTHVPKEHYGFPLPGVSTLSSLHHILMCRMNLNDSCDFNLILNQHLVETEKLYNMSVKNGAIAGDGIIVGD